jgi:hypothetical protein
MRSCAGSGLIQRQPLQRCGVVGSELDGLRGPRGGGRDIALLVKRGGQREQRGDMLRVEGQRRLRVRLRAGPVALGGRGSARNALALFPA